MSLYYIQNQAAQNNKNKNATPNSEFSAERARNIARRYNTTPPAKRSSDRGNTLRDNYSGISPNFQNNSGRGFETFASGLTFKLNKRF